MPAAEFISSSDRETPRIIVPPQMGDPTHTQCTGTYVENLCELAGRVCYDSLGADNSRPSEAYHKHLVESGHWSVYEHAHITIEANLDPIAWLGVPDVCILPDPVNHAVRCTLNLRHILDALAVQGQASKLWRSDFCPETTFHAWEQVLASVLHKVAPVVFYAIPNLIVNLDEVPAWSFVKSEHPREMHVSMFLEESRVWSHEMVRHRANISQRSGRFCDETDRPTLTHPVLENYLEWVPKIHKAIIQGNLDQFNKSSYGIYSDFTDALTGFMVSTGSDKLTARKQARSAARYYLGNGLSTEMIFTASVHHWTEIFRQRCSPHADAAIRNLMVSARNKIEENTQIRFPR